MPADTNPAPAATPAPAPTMRETLGEIRARRLLNQARVRRGQAPLGKDWLPVK